MTEKLVLLDQERQISIGGDQEEFDKVAILAGGIFCVDPSVIELDAGNGRKFVPRSTGVQSYWDGEKLWIYGRVIDRPES